MLKLPLYVARNKIWSSTISILLVLGKIHLTQKCSNGAMTTSTQTGRCADFSIQKHCQQYVEFESGNTWTYLIKSIAKWYLCNGYTQYLWQWHYQKFLVLFQGTFVSIFTCYFVVHTCPTQQSITE